MKSITYFFNQINLLLILLLLGGPYVQSQSLIIGTGTSTSNGAIADPVERFYNYTHSQIVYLSSELSAGGMPAGASITGLGFSISESASSLANFTISMGHTTQTLANPMISIGLTEVRSPAIYTPVVQTASSFDMLPFNTNFTWDGTNNIIIDICTGSNPFATLYGGLRYTPSTLGAMNINRKDLSSNCGNYSGTNYAYRPNIKFDYVANSACFGTPTDGNIIPSATSVCAGQNLTLSLSGASTGNDITYQWESSNTSAGGNYTAISGATAITITTTLTVDTDYRCAVTCTNSGIVSYTNPQYIMVNAPIMATTTTTSATCNGINDGQVVVNATGGSGNYLYRIDGGAFQVSNVFTGLSSGSHVVEVTDGNTCSFIIPFVIGVFVGWAIEWIVERVRDNLLIIPEGGQSPYTYSWVGGNTDYTSNLAGGNHPIYVTDTRNCMLSDTISYTLDSGQVSHDYDGLVNLAIGNGQLSISHTSSLDSVLSYSVPNTAYKNNGVSIALPPQKKRLTLALNGVDVTANDASTTFYARHEAAPFSSFHPTAYLKMENNGTGMVTMSADFSNLGIGGGGVGGPHRPIDVQYYRNDTLLYTDTLSSLSQAFAMTSDTISLQNIEYYNNRNEVGFMVSFNNSLLWNHLPCTCTCYTYPCPCCPIVNWGGVDLINVSWAQNAGYMPPSLENVMVFQAGGNQGFSIVGEETNGLTPTISSVYPLTVTAGDTLTIYGTGFESVNNVVCTSNNGIQIPAEYKTVTFAQLKIRIPAEYPGGAGFVTLTTPEGDSIISPPIAYISLCSPVKEMFARVMFTPTSPNVYLRWLTSPNTSSYEVEYRSSGGAWSTVATNSTNYVVTGIQGNASYEWRVKSICQNGNILYSNIQTFNTLLGDVIEVPPLVMEKASEYFSDTTRTVPLDTWMQTTSGLSTEEVTNFLERYYAPRGGNAINVTCGTPGAGGIYSFNYPYLNACICNIVTVDPGLLLIPSSWTEYNVDDMHKGKNWYSNIHRYDIRFGSAFYLDLHLKGKHRSVAAEHETSGNTVGYGILYACTNNQSLPKNCACNKTVNVDACLDARIITNNDVGGIWSRGSMAEGEVAASLFSVENNMITVHDAKSLRVYNAVDMTHNPQAYINAVKLVGTIVGVGLNGGTVTNSTLNTLVNQVSTLISTPFVFHNGTAGEHLQDMSMCNALSLTLKPNVLKTVRMVADGHGKARGYGGNWDAQTQIGTDFKLAVVIPFQDNTNCCIHQSARWAIGSAYKAPNTESTLRDNVGAFLYPFKPWNNITPNIAWGRMNIHDNIGWANYSKNCSPYIYQAWRWWDVYATQSPVINWVDASDNEIGFRIERAVAYTGNFSPIATLSACEHSFTDNTISTFTQGDSYQYRVIAVGINSLSNSDDSPIIDASHHLLCGNILTDYTYLALNGGAVSVTQNPAVGTNVSSLNLIPVTLTATYPTGKVLEYHFTVTKNSLNPATPTISASTSTTACVGISLTLTGSPATEYAWHRNGVFVKYSNTSPDYTFPVLAGSNQYTLVTIDASSPCPSSQSVSITVTGNLPAATITPSIAPPYCINNPPVLSATPPTGSGYTYSWVGTSPSAATTTTATFTPTNSGNHRVIVTDANGCSASSPWLPITINPLPNANAGIDKTICTNTSTTIGVNASAGLTYSWSPSVSLSSTSVANPTVSYTPAGTQTYTLTVTNSTTGCSKTDNVVVTTLAIPATPSLSASASAVCQGATIILTPSNTSSPLNWYRTSTGSTATTITSTTTSAPRTISAVTTNTDMYSIRAKSGSGSGICLSNFSNSVPVSIKAAPTPTINATPAIVANVISVCNPGQTSGVATLTVNAPISATYSWQRVMGGLATGVGIGASFSPSVATIPSIENNKVFRVSATYPNGCVKNSGNILVKMLPSTCFIRATNGEHTELAEQSLSIYPNPTDAFVNIALENCRYDQANLSLYNDLGQLLYEGTMNIHEQKGETQIEVRSLPTGIYTLVLHTAGGIQTQKIVKE